MARHSVALVVKKSRESRVNRPQESPRFPASGRNLKLLAFSLHGQVQTKGRRIGTTVTGIPGRRSAEPLAWQARHVPQIRAPRQSLTFCNNRARRFEIILGFAKGQCVPACELSISQARCFRSPKQVRVGTDLSTPKAANGKCKDFQSFGKRSKCKEPFL